MSMFQKLTPSGYPCWNIWRLGPVDFITVEDRPQRRDLRSGDFDGAAVARLVLIKCGIDPLRILQF